MGQRESGRPKVIDTTLEIAAPPEAVWKAITDPRELERWFPLQARVAPGEGGEVFLSWGPPWEGGSRIDAWEPGGDTLEGTVVVNHAPYEFAGTVLGLNDALFSLRTHEAGGPKAKDGYVAALFASTWGVSKPDVEALGERWKRLLDELAEKEA